MKTITVTILKKNRKYFAAQFESGCKCKILISPESEALEIGEHTLLVEDISVRTKYGTDLIYSLKGEVKKEAAIVTLQHFAYNSWLVDECKSLGGRWDADSSAWVFSEIVSDKVEELDEIYNSELLDIEITAKDDLFACNKPIYFLGYPLAKATGRDSGAKLGDGVYMIAGNIGSGGSMKNWGTVIDEGAVFRLQVPKVLLDRHCPSKENSRFHCSIIGEVEEA